MQSHFHANNRPGPQLKGPPHPYSSLYFTPASLSSRPFLPRSKIYLISNSQFISMLNLRLCKGSDILKQANNHPSSQLRPLIFLSICRLQFPPLPIPSLPTRKWSILSLHSPLNSTEIESVGGLHILAQPPRQLKGAKSVHRYNHKVELEVWF